MVRLGDSIPSERHGKGILDNVEAKSTGGYSFHSFRSLPKGSQTSTLEGKLLLAYISAHPLYRPHVELNICSWIAGLVASTVDTHWPSGTRELFGHV